MSKSARLEQKTPNKEMKNKNKYIPISYQKVRKSCVHTRQIHRTLPYLNAVIFTNFNLQRHLSLIIQFWFLSLHISFILKRSLLHWFLFLYHLVSTFCSFLSVSKVVLRYARWTLAFIPIDAYFIHYHYMYMTLTVNSNPWYNL